MAFDETRRLAKSVLADDIAVADALGGINAYQPADEKCNVANVAALRTEMETAQGVETRQEAAAKTARDNATAKEWEFHNTILRVKQLVSGQFGSDSNEVQSIGLKKKSEYSRPHRSETTEPAPATAQ
ncbi:MAG TPA: hypothetical protein VL171_12750 [Verrucomicrobiae bacterium]|nr:hypothetical protein [Verrucomicrobiae bacterium]